MTLSSNKPVERHASVGKVATAFFLWMALNIVLSFSNKYLFKFKNFRFPILIVLSGTIATWLGTWAILYFNFESYDWMKSKSAWKSIMALGIIHGIDIGLENFSLVYISISLNQIIKATVPAFTLILSWLFEGKKYNAALITSTAMTVFGALLTVYKNPQIHGDGWYGFGAAATSSLCAATSTILMGLLLQKNKINAVALACYSSVPSVMVLLPTFFLLEYPLLLQKIERPSDANKRSGVGLWLFIICFAALLYNLARLYLIRFTEAHYSVIAGNVKIGVIVGCSMIVFGDHQDFSARNWAGAIISLLGFTVYSYVKYQEIRQHHASAELLARNEQSLSGVNFAELDQLNGLMRADEATDKLVALMDQ